MKPIVRSGVMQSGAIIVRRFDSDAQILLVRSRQRSDDWIFPKGHIEAYESPEEAALREAYEEAGISGVVIGPVGAPLEFDSNSERVIVQYFLIYARSACMSSEGRDPTWFSVSEAGKQLTHEDSRTLLNSVETEIAVWTSERMNGSDRDGFTQLMLAEFAHIGDSLLRSEESGETRLAFFLTFAGGVGTAVGFLAGSGGPLQNQGRLLVAVALVILLLLGYSTFLRVVVRNAASDLYKRRLSCIRRYFLESVDDQRLYFMPFAPFEHAWRKASSWKHLRSGGWLETMAVVEASLGGLLGAFAAAWLGDQSWTKALPLLHTLAAQLLLGLIAGVLIWLSLICRGNSLYLREMLEKVLERDINNQGNAFP